MTIPHALITSPDDRVACPLGPAELSASVCARRHLAREHRGHRHLRVVSAEARYPLCAACPLGGVAQRALGLRGVPGAVPRPSVEYGTRPVVVEPVRDRPAPARDRRRPVVDDVAGAHLRPVRHASDVWACGVMPWGAIPPEAL